MGKLAGSSFSFLFLMHLTCSPSITLCQPQRLAGEAGTSCFPPSSEGSHFRAVALSSPDGLAAAFCVLCALKSWPPPLHTSSCLWFFVLPLVPHPAQLSRCVFSANCIQLCFGGLQPLCFSVPFTLDYPALISCPSSP